MWREDSHAPGYELVATAPHPIFRKLLSYQIWSPNYDSRTLTQQFYIYFVFIQDGQMSEYVPLGFPLSQATWFTFPPVGITTEVLTGGVENQKLGLYMWATTDAEQRQMRKTVLRTHVQDGYAGNQRREVPKLFYVSATESTVFQWWTKMKSWQLSP